MIYLFEQHEIRKYLRRNKNTMQKEIVHVSNTNQLSIERHMELLNLNDDEYEYIEYLGDVNKQSGL